MLSNRRGLSRFVIGAILAGLLSANSDVLAAVRPIKVGDKVRLREGGTRKPERIGFVAGLDNDTLRLCTKGEIRLDRVVTTDNRSIEFPYVGAVYSAETKTLSGVSESGEEVALPISEVNFADVTMFIRDKTVPAKFTCGEIQRRLQYNTVYPILLARVPVDSIRTIKVWRKTNYTGISLMALAGAALGFAVGSAVEEEPEPSIFPGPSRNAKIVIDTILGLVAGSITGYLIFKSKWQAVPVQRLKVGVTASATNGVGVTCSIGF